MSHHSNIDQGYIDAILDDLDRATTTDDEVRTALQQAVYIAQAGGIEDRLLLTLLRLAGMRQMTPDIARALREVGINPDPADAIVIERAEMPPVTSDASNVWTTNGYQAEARLRGCNVANLRARALSLLALAEYLAAHPPVPPVSDADVETLAGLIRPFLSGYVPNANATVDQAARRLLATGHVSVTK